MYPLLFNYYNKLKTRISQSLLAVFSTQMRGASQGSGMCMDLGLPYLLVYYRFHLAPFADLEGGIYSKEALNREGRSFFR